MKKRTVLITGGAGFIGSHLCDHFLQQGYRIIAVDNFITGHLQNLKHLSSEKSFRLITHDINKPLKIKDKIDIILHFASLASPIDYLNYPIQTLKVGSLGSHNMLGMAKDKRSRFLLASTSEVYGDPLVHPQKETYWGNVNPVGPRGVYDESKRFAESITLAYYRVHGVDARIVRIFNTYGPRMRLNDGRVVPNFIFQTLTGKDITVYGKGSQTRSFCFVSDLIRGIDALLKADYHYPVNLGNPEEMTILVFAKFIIRLTRSKSRIIFNPLPEDDPKIRKPDISLAYKIMKWKPRIPLDEGLSLTVDYFRKIIPASYRKINKNHRSPR
jgi:dTDP-glucose 4,6-dehydratase